jgi:hypothetical protein
MDSENKFDLARDAVSLHRDTLIAEQSNRLMEFETKLASVTGSSSTVVKERKALVTEIDDISAQLNRLRGQRTLEAVAPPVVVKPRPYDRPARQVCCQRCYFKPEVV